MPYRVTFKADYVEKRSRLTTFFRLLLAIPHIIFLSLLRARRGRRWSSSRGSRCSSRALSAGDVRLRRGLAALLDARLRLPVAASPTSTRRSRAAPQPLIRSTSTSPAQERVQPAEGSLPAHPRDPGSHHPLRDADRRPAGRGHRLVRDRGARPPAEGPAGHDRAGHELPAARLRVPGAGHRGLAALHRRDGGPAASRPRRRSARWPPAHRPRAPSTRRPCHPAATPRPSARRPSRPRRAPPSPSRRPRSPSRPLRRPRRPSRRSGSSRPSPPSPRRRRPSRRPRRLSPSRHRSPNRRRRPPATRSAGRLPRTAPRARADGGAEPAVARRLAGRRAGARPALSGRLARPRTTRALGRRRTTRAPSRRRRRRAAARPLRPELEQPVAAGPRARRPRASSSTSLARDATPA